MKTKSQNRSVITLLTICYLSFNINNSLRAQNVGINGNGNNAHLSALLDIDAVATPSLGILIPRIALQAINLAAPVSLPATSLLVYNTASASTGTNAVSAGYYYWDGIKWVRFAYSASGSSSAAWDLLGNTGTTAGTNFVGTTDDQDLIFKRNNVNSGLLNSALRNTSFGVSALQANTTGSNNVAIGTQALFSNTSGFSNNAIGYQSLFSNLNGFGNAALGQLSLFANTSGVFNTAIGHRALAINTNGSANTAIGSAAMNNNTTGVWNTAVGYQSMDLGVGTGSYNVAVGSWALRNAQTNDNVAVGAFAIQQNTLGASNTAIGNASQFNNIGNNNTSIGFWSLRSSSVTASNTGSNNVALGNASMRLNESGSDNVAAGVNSMDYNTTGSKNTAIGTRALYTSANTSSNVAIGYESMYINSTGIRNTAVGYNTLRNNNTSDLTAIGFNALQANTTGQSNVALGSRALENNTTGDFNIGIGTNALRSNTVGIWNVAVGSSVLQNNTNSFNTGVGHGALNFNTTGDRNSALGEEALYGNTTGSQNSAVGQGALRDNTTGNNNVGLGYQSLRFNTTGGVNTAVGVRALMSNITGNSNTALGYLALNYLTSGSDNVAIGRNAGGTNSTVVTGNNNTFLGTSTDAIVDNLTNATAIGYGAQVGQSNALILGGTGSNSVNVGIGTATPAHALTVKRQYSTYTPTDYMFALQAGNGSTRDILRTYYNNDAGVMEIGYWGMNNQKVVIDGGVYNSHAGIYIYGPTNILKTQISGDPLSYTYFNSNNVAIGMNTVPGGLFELALDQGRKPGTNTWTIPSDERLKNIKGNYTKGLKELMQLTPITYNYKNVGERTFKDEVLKTQQIGFSAQEVQKVFPEAVGTDADGYLNLNTHSILVAYLNAIKELNDENKKQKDTNTELLKRIEALEKK